MLGRRGFLRGAIAAPFVAKQTAQHAAESLSRVGLTIPNQMVGLGTAVNGGIGFPGASNAQWAKIIANSAARKELESLYFESERNVSQIDPDISVLRSISLSAKIAYQRQRNVSKRLDGLMDVEGWYGRFVKFGKRMSGL